MPIPGHMGIIISQNFLGATKKFFEPKNFDFSLSTVFDFMIILTMQQDIVRWKNSVVNYNVLLKISTEQV